METVSIQGLASDPAQPRTVYLGTLEGLFRSDDEGLTWSLVNPFSARSLRPGPFGSPTTLFAVDGAGFVRSDDRGEIWIELADDRQWSGGALLLGAFPLGAEVGLYASTACCQGGPNHPPSIFQTWRSVDSGANVEEITEQVGFASAVAFDPREPATLYAVSDLGFFRSQDQGATWQPVPGDGLPTGVNSRTIAVDARSDPGLVLAGFDDGQILVSADRGDSWRPSAHVQGLVLELQVSSGPAGASYYARATGGGLFADFNADGRWLPLRTEPLQGAISFLTPASTAQDSLPTLYAVIGGRLAHYQPAYRYFPQIGQGQGGEIGFQTTLLANNTGGENFLQVDFFDSSGSPLPLDFGEGDATSSMSLVLERGESREFQTLADSDLQVGYARVLAGASLGGTAVFTRTDIPSGQILYEAGVPLTDPLTDFSIPLDSVGMRDSGLALVNTSNQQAQLLLRLYDDAFQLIATADLALPAGGHLAKFVFELFPQAEAQAREMKGTVTVASDQPLAAVTLRQNEDPSQSFPDFVPTLTVFPVIPGRADEDQ